MSKQQPPAPAQSSSKPPPKRPERVGVKRGPYKPREKPAWNKEIKAKEREEEKKKAKKQRQVKRAKVKPQPAAPLTELPAEVLDIIVQYILPTAHPLADYLPSPGELPYPSLTMNVTSSMKAKSERWGPIPQSVLDIINFSKCCRQTMYACERIVAGLGGSTGAPKKPVAEKARESSVSSSSAAAGTEAPASPATSIPIDPELEAASGKKRLFLRIDHGGDSCDSLMALALRSRETLEHLVLHHCGKDHGSLRDAPQRDYGQASPMNRTIPLQAGRAKDYIAFPNLRSLQVGSDVCGECVQACLHLIAGRTFFSTSSQPSGSRRWVLTRMYGGYSGYTATNFDFVAAPNLEAIQIQVPNPAIKSRHQSGSSYSDIYQRMIDKDLRKKIKVFSLILPAVERRWGGFGVGGHSSTVHQKTKEVVEKDLAERARIYLIGPGPSRPKGKDANVDKVKEKWASLAKTALVKPAPERKLDQNAARAVALALIASIQPRKAAVAKGKEKEKEAGPPAKEKEVDDAAKEKDIDPAGEDNVEASGAKATGGETDAQSTAAPVHPDSASEPAGEKVNASQPGGSKSPLIAPHAQMTAREAGEDAGPSGSTGTSYAFSSKPSAPRTLMEAAALAEDGEVFGALPSPEPREPSERSSSPDQRYEPNDEDDDDVDDDEEDSDEEGKGDETAAVASGSGDGTATGPAGAGPAPDGPTRKKRAHRRTRDGDEESEYHRQANANRKRLHEQFPAVLRDIAETFPNLESLQVLRQGSARIDVIEGMLTPDEYAAVYVTPLRKLDKLQYLDLGLAVVGKREVRDFPLALTIPDPPPEASKLVVREITARKMILEADIARAVREGDAWRKMILDRFVLGVGVKEPDAVGTGGAGNPNHPPTLAAATQEAEDQPPKGWPRGLKRGFVYSADLHNRATGKGVLTTWTKVAPKAAGEEMTLDLTKSKVGL